MPTISRHLSKIMTISRLSPEDIYAFDFANHRHHDAAFRMRVAFRGACRPSTTSHSYTPLPDMDSSSYTIPPATIVNSAGCKRSSRSQISQGGLYKKSVGGNSTTGFASSSAGIEVIDRFKASLVCFLALLAGAYQARIVTKGR